MTDSTWGSANAHRREMCPAPNRRKRCRCGCGGPVTHHGTANGVVLYAACEWSVRRWVHEQRQRLRGEGGRGR